MYYNGCKYARSKTVRKFRLSVKSEEAEIEERMNYLASMLAPLYERATPKAYENQCKYEQEAPDCRLGFHNGKPFSGKGISAPRLFRDTPYLNPLVVLQV